MASPNEQERAGMTGSAIERQVADSLLKELLAWRKIVRPSPTYPSISSLSKLYFCFLECVLCYPLSRSLEPWWAAVHPLALDACAELVEQIPCLKEMVCFYIQCGGSAASG